MAVCLQLAQRQRALFAGGGRQKLGLGDGQVRVEPVDGRFASAVAAPGASGGRWMSGAELPGRSGGSSSGRGTGLTAGAGTPCDRWMGSGVTGGKGACSGAW